MSLLYSVLGGVVVVGGMLRFMDWVYGPKALAETGRGPNGTPRR